MGNAHLHAPENQSRDGSERKKRSVQLRRAVELSSKPFRVRKSSSKINAGSLSVSSSSPLSARQGGNHGGSKLALNRAVISSQIGSSERISRASLASLSSGGSGGVAVNVKQQSKRTDYRSKSSCATRTSQIRKPGGDFGDLNEAQRAAEKRFAAIAHEQITEGSSTSALPLLTETTLGATYGQFNSKTVSSAANDQLGAKDGSPTNRANSCETGAVVSKEGQTERTLMKMKGKAQKPTSPSQINDLTETIIKFNSHSIENIAVNGLSSAGQTEVSVNHKTTEMGNKSIKRNEHDKRVLESAQMIHKQYHRPRPPFVLNRSSTTYANMSTSSPSMGASIGHTSLARTLFYGGGNGWISTTTGSNSTLQQLQLVEVDQHQRVKNWIDSQPFGLDSLVQMEGDDEVSGI